MNNEPVGYYYAEACIDIRDCSEQMKRNGFPLYTHPHSEESVKAKTLTDEEIYEIWEEFNGEIKNFARAILRKAQGEDRE